VSSAPPATSNEGHAEQAAKDLVDEVDRRALIARIIGLART
jgi:hypothetical protein